MITAQEYIAKLQLLVGQYGDLECVDTYGDPMGDPEFSPDGDTSAFVLADKA